MKGQTEILGLMMIVVMIIVIGAIFLTFSINKEEDTVLRESTKVNNLMNAVMKVSPCSNEEEQMDDVIRICYEEERNFCEMNCKEFVKEEITKILDNAPMRISYYSFRIEKDNEEITEYSVKKGQCNDRKFAKKYPLRAGRDTLVVWLEICQQ